MNEVTHPDKWPDLAELERLEQDQSERHWVRPLPASDPSQVYSVRIPVDKLEALRRLALARGQRPSAMMRDWVLDRLRRETVTITVHTTLTPLEITRAIRDALRRVIWHV